MDDPVDSLDTNNNGLKKNKRAESCTKEEKRKRKEGQQKRDFFS